MFKALVLEQVNGNTQAQLRQLHSQDLPAGNVRIAVDYSSLNYKDGLAVSGTGKIIRDFPMVPGIDLAGSVLESSDARYAVGDKVIITGWGVGERYWGGYAQQARVNADWLVPLPAGLTTQQAMIIGTAGLTAMLCVMALQEGGLQPEAGKVVVTGAAGGVGSIAVLLLAQLGYHVVAVTGRPDTHAYLSSLGATEFLSRDAMLQPARPLENQRWLGAVDVVGGAILSRVLAEMQYNGVVAACGLASSFKLDTTVMPFILRNVRLQGVDSVSCPFERRQVAWQRLAKELPANAYTELSQVIGLDAVPAAAQTIIAGGIKGRILVDPNL